MADAPLRPDIEAANALLVARRALAKEVKDLARHLWHDETVERMVGAALDKSSGLLTLTSHRLLFLHHDERARPTDDFTMDRIAAIDWLPSTFWGTIVISASGTTAEITMVELQAGEAITAAVRHRTAGPAPVSSEGDVLDLIRKLAELHAAGILTDEEFTGKKAELLRRL